ncbi:inner nuclear membrane protein Man1-like [Bactrocera tryoni]|uniref:inner nuclear membrane protein Man1-like n=1 Tax=Bactrocera tryoni TaxID=59916 RepID=UPI001A9678A7|nr:inner nuclear membrane protein Man1-like [Bactrocera tryoni]
MSLENVENLTDIELRQKLLEYDFPNVPITETSRGFLVKKLKNHIKNMKNRKVPTRTYMTLRAKEELNNLVTKAHDWNHQSLQSSALLSEEHTANADPELYSIANNDNRMADQVRFLLPNPLFEQNVRNSIQLADPQLSLANSSPYGYLTILSKVLGLKDNYTNSVWWAFTLFFLTITFMYMTKIADFSKNINEGNTNYVICDKLNSPSPFLRPPYICIEKERVEPALTIVRQLMMQLKKPSERNYCYDRKQTKAISVTELIRQELKGGNLVDIRNLKAAQYLITCNPQWKIDMVDDKGDPVIFIGVDNVLANHNIFFVLKQPEISLTCHLYNIAYRFINLGGNLSLLVCALILLCFPYFYVRRIQEQHLQAVHRFIDKIIEELQNRAANSESSEGREVDVNHLCDQLIPSSKRKFEIRFFNEALKELEVSDNRVRFDLTVRDGQECRTISWIDYSDELLTGSPAGHREGLFKAETSC